MKRNASSLILVVIIMSALIVVVFGANRLTLVQYNQATRDEDNVSALYAAKAGIEDGLIRYRYSKNAEITKDLVQRIDLTKGRNLGEIAESKKIRETDSYDPQSQYYDLAMSFRTNLIGDFNFNDTPPSNPPAVVKSGDVLELTGFPDLNREYYLRLSVKFFREGSTTIPCTENEALVQVQQIDSGLSSLYKQRTLKKSEANPFDTLISQPHFVVNPPGLGTTTFRLRPYLCDIKFAVATTLNTDGRGMRDDGATIPNDTGPEFGGLITKVVSTGYYGDTKRSLIAEINRISGQLIGIYDFNVYSGTGDIRPIN